MIRKFVANKTARGHFIEYLLERPDIRDVWREYVEHDFLARIANGTLPTETFKQYLVQNYLYLVSILIVL